MRGVRAFALWLALLTLPCQAQLYSDNGHAANAYAGLISRFWIGLPGSSSIGHFAILTNGATVNGAAGEINPGTDSAWAVAGAVNALYAMWELSGPNAADALNKIKAQWAYAATKWPVSTLGTIGNVANATAVSLDDASYSIIGREQFYDATADLNALLHAKTIIDAVKGRWENADFGGGLYYSDTASLGKNFVNPPFADAEIIYYQDECALGSTQCTAAAAYLTDAASLAAWIQSTLQRNNNPTCSFAGSDYLIWAGIYNADLTTPTVISNGCSQPNQIAVGSSVVELAYDMAWADLNARLYAVTGTAAYQTAAQNIAASILLKHTDATGAFFDDRDARSNGLFAYYFAIDVVPLLSAANQAAFKAAYLATARGQQANRSADGCYGGDYLGPFAPGGIWAGLSGGVFNQDRMEICGNTAIWYVMGLKWATN